MVRCIVGWLVAIVAVLVTMPAAESIAIESVQHLVTHTYDSPRAPTADAYTHYDRDPPAARVHLRRHHANDLGSSGSSARVDGVITATNFTYDITVQFVSAAHSERAPGFTAGAMTQGQVQAMIGAISSPAPSVVAAKGASAVTRSFDEFASLRGATPTEIGRLIPDGWLKSATKGPGGVRYANPERPGEQIRIMPGNRADPNVLKQGPYLRISRNGTVSDPIPLDGNPGLR